MTNRKAAFRHMVCFGVALMGVTVQAQSARAAMENRAEVTRVGRIWDAGRISDRERARLEFPDLIEFKGHWYCAFREGDEHGNHPSGRVRVIRTADLEEGEWRSVALFEWEGGDVREARLSVTAEGQLMITTCIYFVSLARAEGLRESGSLEESRVIRQSATWLSPDGENWSSVHLDESGVNTWRWDTTWDRGMGYSISYVGPVHGALFRTRDGKSWRVLADDIFPDGHNSNEAGLAFAPDGTAYCLLRSRIRSDEPAERLEVTFLGVSRFPYAVWTWKDLEIGGSLGGPKLVRLSDGRLVAAGRYNKVEVVGRPGNVCLFWVNIEDGTLMKFAEIEGGHLLSGRR